MRIHQDFVGGNIKVVRQDGDVVYVENELRDTTENWFYWAFCVEGAQGKRLTFRFQPDRVGYFGPAISHDLKTWTWLNQKDGEDFTYTFQKGENKVYFAHDLLYHPDRFEEFAQKKGLQIETFCQSRSGKIVPCVKIGNGSRTVILTARHHACEATGNYVLEGVIDEWIKRPIPDTTLLCVPFVDYDGVLSGDQGKARFPHDHNRDYDKETPSIYFTTAKIKEYAEKNGCLYAFDFHSPWHCGGRNDVEFIVQNSFEKLEKLNAFGALFEEEMTKDAFPYEQKNDMPFMTEWNLKSANFASFMTEREENELAFSLETPYFGTKNAQTSQENLVETGRCFCRALYRYEKNRA